MKRHRGLTLIEIAIGLAIVAVLAALAVPGFVERIGRARLAGAAETLASDLAEARFESARSGEPLYLVFSAGSDWCYAVAREPRCDCHTAQACQLKVARAADAPGVDLVRSEDAQFDPAASEPPGGSAQWQGLDGTQSLSVSLTPLGRARVCTTTGLRGYTPC